MTNHSFLKRNPFCKRGIVNSLGIALTPTLLLAFVITVGPMVSAPQTGQDLWQSLHWRSIGPFRGGRTRAAAGVPSQPNVIYVGSGEGLHRPDLSVGDGIYKSTDAGKTWTHLGLRDGQQIPQIAVDPRNADHLLVAVAGHPYGPNEERGIFRSTDGGRTFQRVLYKDENTGAADVLIDASNSEIAYASLWEAREGPWENGSWNGTGGGIFKSTDGGKTWQQLIKGLPEGIVQANLAIAPSSLNRLFGSVATTRGVGLYRSDDGGESWVIATTDPRPAARIGGGDLPVPKIDPKNPDVIYSASVVTWKSIDAGKTWT